MNHQVHLTEKILMFQSGMNELTEGGETILGTLLRSANRRPKVTRGCLKTFTIRLEVNVLTTKALSVNTRWQVYEDEYTELIYCTFRIQVKIVSEI